MTYLDDSRQASSIGLGDSLSLLREIQKEIKDNSLVDQGILIWSAQIEADLEYLQKEVDAAKADIEELRSTVGLPYDPFLRTAINLVIQNTAEGQIGPSTNHSNVYSHYFSCYLSPFLIHDSQCPLPVRRS